MNKHEENRQFITCSGDMYVLIWDLLKPEQDTDAPAQAAPAMAEEVTTYLIQLICIITD